MQTILDLVQPKPDARWVIFYSVGDGPDGGLYSPLTMLAYDMNAVPLTYGHGAPLRLRNEIQLGFKQVKWLAGIDFVADFRGGRRWLRWLQRRPRVLRLPPIHLSCSAAVTG